MARGRLYTTGKERARSSIKRIMNRGAASFFFHVFLSLSFSPCSLSFPAERSGENVSRTSEELSTMRVVLLVARRSRGGCLTRSACYMHYSRINYRGEMEIFFARNYFRHCTALVGVIIIIFCILIGQLLYTSSYVNEIRLFVSREYDIFNNIVIYDAYCVIWNTHVYSIRILFFDK